MCYFHYYIYIFSGIWKWLKKYEKKNVTVSAEISRASSKLHISKPRINFNLFLNLATRTWSCYSPTTKSFRISTYDCANQIMGSISISSSIDQNLAQTCHFLHRPPGLWVDNLSALEIWPCIKDFETAHSNYQRDLFPDINVKILLSMVASL